MDILRRDNARVHTSQIIVQKLSELDYENFYLVLSPRQIFTFSEVWNHCRAGECSEAEQLCNSGGKSSPLLNTKTSSERDFLSLFKELSLIHI